MKYKLSAVIPCVQYGNLQPEIELEGENIEELHETAMKHIADVWDKYGEKPLSTKSTEQGEKVTSFTGEELFYNEDTHTYTDKDGNILKGGSTYADESAPKFDKVIMVPKIAKAWSVSEDELDKVWKMSGETSSSYGTAIHNALESFHLHKEMGEDIAKQKEMEYNYVLPKNKHLREVVMEFDEKFGTDAVVEVLISDVENKMAGQIDRLVILDEKKKVCRVGDYKTNAELDPKKIKKYNHQLSFYAHILMNKGWTVEGIDIFHYSDGWTKIELDVLDLIE